MANRDRNKSFSRKERTREEAEIKTAQKTLISFNFKDLDQTQPTGNPQTIALWHQANMLAPLLERIRQVCQLSRTEAVQQQQLKFYDNFPPKKSTDFFHPGHVPQDVYWGVLKNIGGQVGTVAGYLVEDVFHVVFLDMEHKFWISEKKNT
ncbi:hypothetical protein [Pseudomonas sp. PGPPP4]|uniref:hypothetical protein n=1 Tax=Pseudomonas sp. PGPPP4 TaxID=2015556 RepID=UPI00257AC659|nr:hypothetical protein [Pseudomonas sp. PGPPP4]